MVQKNIAEKTESEDLALFVVWIPMFPGDSRAKATASMKLVPGKRARHYWDAEKIIGKDFSSSLELPQDRVPVAWDVYLAFDKGAVWKKTPPVSTQWMHQVSKLKANFDNILDGEKLWSAVEALLLRD